MLSWLDNRWHCDGAPIHAGYAMEVCWVDGTWEPVRIESADAGQRLYAHFEHHGECFYMRVDPNGENPRELRWPQETKRMRTCRACDGEGFVDGGRCESCGTRGCVPC